MTRRHTPADTLLTLTETNPGQLADYVLCMVLCLVEFMSVSCKLALLLFEFFFGYKNPNGLSIFKLIYIIIYTMDKRQL